MKIPKVGDPVQIGYFIGEVAAVDPINQRVKVKWNRFGTEMIEDMSFGFLEEMEAEELNRKAEGDGWEPDDK